VHFEREILRTLQRIEHKVSIIERLLDGKSNQYTILVTQEDTMAIGNITAGSTGTFASTLLDNGVPFVAPSGSTFVPSYTYSSPDSSVSFAPSADTTSAVVTVPASDTAKTLVIGSSTVAPDGTTASGTITVTLSPSTGSQTFTVGLTQTA
jgi:hypothetical protein